MNKIFREYCSLPWFLPLLSYYSHGVAAHNEPLTMGDIKNAKKKKLVLALNKYDLAKWKEQGIEAVATGAPFAIYRKMHNITQDSDAKGTIVFPPHACEGIDNVYNIEQLCEELEKLPEEYKPFTINLHINDIERGKDLEYKKRGYEVVSAGNIYDENFPKNFYNNLRRHKYATGNEPGSQVFYCLEMGIPYFYTGEEAKFVVENFSHDAGLKINGKSAKELDYMEALSGLIPTKASKVISEELKQYVDSIIGEDEIISAEELKEVLTDLCKKHPFMVLKEYISTLFYYLKRPFASKHP